MAKLSTQDVGSVSQWMATAIAAKVANPNDWNMACRTAAEALRLDVTRIAFSNVLGHTCRAVVDEAQKQGRTVEEVRAAV